MDFFATESAPAAVGPYSQAVRAGDFLFCSGQIGLVPETGGLAGPDLAAQARQMLTNLQAVLEAAGLGLTNVIKTTVFLADMADFAEFNEIYAGFFSGHRPARSAVQVTALPLGARVEIECVAVSEAEKAGKEQKRMAGLEKRGKGKNKKNAKTEPLGLSKEIYEAMAKRIELNSQRHRGRIRDMESDKKENT